MNTNKDVRSASANADGVCIKQLDETNSSQSNYEKYSLEDSDPDHNDLGPNLNYTNSLTHFLKLNSSFQNSTPFMARGFLIYLRTTFSRSNTVPVELCRILHCKSTDDDSWGKVIALYVNLINAMYSGNVFHRDFNNFERQQWMKTCIKKKVIVSIRNGRRLPLPQKDHSNLLVLLKKIILVSNIIANDFYNKWFLCGAEGHMFKNALKNTVDDTINQLCEDLPENENVINAMQRIVQKTTRKIVNSMQDEALETLKSIPDKILEMFESVFDWFCRTYEVVKETIKQWGVNIKVYFVMFTTYISNAMQEASSMLWGFFKYFLGDYIGVELDEVDPEDESDTSEFRSEGHGLARNVTNFLFKVCTALSPKPIDKDKYELFSASVNLTDDLADYAVKMYKKLMYIFTGDLEYKFGNMGNKVLTKSIHVSKILNHPNTVTLIRQDAGYRQEIIDLATELSILGIQCDNAKQTGFSVKVSQMVNALNKLVRENRPVNARTKREGLLVSLSGPPGSGKSTLAEICKIFCQWVTHSSAYVKVPNSNYHDGAQGAKVWCMPEFCQDKDVNVRALEMIDVVRNISNDAVVLNFSGIEQKGSITSELEYAILTTNSDITSEEFGIIDPGAFQRRGIHLKVMKRKHVTFTSEMTWPEFIEMADFAWDLQLSVGPEYTGGRDFLKHVPELHKLYSDPKDFPLSGHIRLDFSQLLRGMINREHYLEDHPQTPGLDLQDKVDELADLFPEFTPTKRERVPVDESVDRSISEEITNFFAKCNDAEGHCLTDPECECPATSKLYKSECMVRFLPYLRQPQPSETKLQYLTYMARTFLKVIYHSDNMADQILYSVVPKEHKKEYISVMSAGSKHALSYHPLVDNIYRATRRQCPFIDSLEQILSVLLFTGSIQKSPCWDNEEENPTFNVPIELDAFQQRCMTSQLTFSMLCDVIPIEIDWKMIMLIMATAGVVAGGLAWLAIKVNKYFDSVGHSDTTKGKVRRPKPNRTKLRQGMRRQMEKESAGHGKEQPNLKLVSLLRHNLRKVTLFDRSGNNYTVNALFIGGLTMMINTHIVSCVKQLAMVRVRQFNGNRMREDYIDVSNRDVTVHIGEGDMSFLEFKPGTSNINQSASLSKYLFQEDRDLTDTSLFRIDPDTTKLVPVGSTFQVSGNYRIKGTDVTESNYYTVPGVTSKPGDCGVPYVGLVDGEWKLLFIHAGQLINGPSSVIRAREYGEVMGHAAKGMEMTTDVLRILKSSEQCMCREFGHANYMATSATYYSGEGGMDYVPHPYNPHYTHPCMKSAKRPIGRKGHKCFDKHAAKRTYTVHPISDELANLVAENPSALYKGFIENFPIWIGGVKIRSIEEALFGCEYFNGLDKKSSEGLWRFLSGDTILKQQIYELKIIPSDFRAAVEERIRYLKQGKPYFKLTALSLKSELRLFSAEYPRVYMPTQLPDIVAAKMVLGDLMQLIGTNATTRNCGRYNPHGEQAEYLYKILTKYEKYGESDVSSLDNNQKPLMAHLFAHFMANISGTTGEDYTAIHTMCANLTQYLFVHKNTVYSAHMGLPSGDFMTALFNAFSQYVVYNWTKIIAYGNVPFDDVMSFVCMGDDTAASFNPEYDLVNMRTIAWIAKIDFGYTYTGSDKQPITEPYVDHVPGFLSRTFCIVEGKVAHALDKESIIGFLNYCHKDTPVEEVIVQTTNVALMEAVYHGREFFEILRNQFLIANKARGESRVIKDWNFYRHRWLKNYNRTIYNSSIDTSDDFYLHWFDDENSPNLYGKFEGQDFIL